MGFFGVEVSGLYGQIILYIQIVIAILLAAHILIKKQNPQVCMGWLLAVALFPLIAAFFYITIGMNPFQQYAARKRRSKSLAQLEKAPMAAEEIRIRNDKLLRRGNFSNFERANDWISQFTNRPIAAGNKLELLINSDVVYPRLRKAISEAKDFVLVQFYQIQADEIGLAFLDLLAERAKAGVRVYVLFDALGSITLKPAMVKHYQSLGLQMSRFLEIHPIKRRFQINWRNHRKLVVIDGKEAFVGGFNIGRIYLQGDLPEKPAWVDLLFGVKGPAIADFVRQFLEDWHFTTGKLIFEVAKEVPCLDEHAETSDTLLAVVPSGPSETCAPFYSTVQNILYESKARVWIMTPYFVPDASLLHAMRVAVARGVHVRVIVPEASNHPLTDLCSSSYFSELQAYGIDLLRYQFGVCHCKVVLADDDLVFAGSSNMDYRSFFLNFETDLFIRDKTLGRSVEEFFIRIAAMSCSLKASDISARPIDRLLIRRFMRLFAPLM